MLQSNIIYLNKLFFAEEKLYFKVFNKEKTTFYLSSRENTINTEASDNYLDLKKVIVDNYENVVKESRYRLIALNDKNEEIKVFASEYMEGKQYICKNTNIIVNEITFNIDVYVKSGAIIIDIINSNEKQIIANVNKVIMTDKTLELELEFAKLENNEINDSIDKIKKPYILLEEDNVELSVKKNNLVYRPLEVNKNIAIFKINLSDFENMKEGRFNCHIHIGSARVLFDMSEEIQLKKILCDNEENFIRIIYIYTSDKELSIEAKDNFSINPLVKNININNEIKFSGSINCDSSIAIYNNVDLVIRFVSRNKSHAYPKEAVIKGGKFEVTLTNSEIFALRDMFNGQWDLQAELFINDKQVFVTPLILQNGMPGQDLLKEKIVLDKYTVYAIPYTAKESTNLSLRFDNPTSIAKIIKIRIKQDIISFRLRTKKKISDDFNDYIANIKADNQIIEMRKVKKNGEKTFTISFQVKDMDKFVDFITTNGLTIIQDINGERFIDNMNDIDKDIIIRNIKEQIVKSKKYKKLCVKLYNKLFMKMKINKKKVLFESFLGRNCSGNPKYIYEQMIKDGLDKEYKLIWILNDLSEEISGNGKKVKRKSLMYYYHMATSKYWVFNCRQGNEIKKRKENVYLQTWHGTPLKKLGMDMDNVSMAGQNNIISYKDTLYKNTRRWDYLLSQNDYSTEIFRRCFAFDKKMLDYGYPANDILYNENTPEKINSIKDKFNLPKDKKVILYAPTWRDNNFMKKGHYKMDIELDLKKMQEELGNEYIILLRMHYLIMNSINIEDYKGFVYDFSQGFDIQELYLISDVLITDYSSVMFDYSNLNRQVIFFAYDIEDYRDSLRGFYFDFENEAPGPIDRTTDEVIYSLTHLDEVYEKYKDKKDAFYNKFCHIDNGTAAVKVINEVFKEK